MGTNVDQEPAVIVRGAYKYYGSKKDPNKKIILNHLNMTVERGSIYGLLGSSGCGKTTLLSCVVGRRNLISGSIKVLSGAPAGSIAPRIGYMPQEVALVSEFTVKDAIFFFGRIYGVEDDRIERRFAELTELLELPDENRQIGNCSGGQQRRVSFAAALVHEPELLILDEPTVGLDPVLRDKIWNHLVYLAKVKNTAVVITTHYIEEARQAQRIGLMRGGQLLAEESPDTLMRKFGCETLEEAYLILSIKQSKVDGTEEPTVVESSDTPAEEIVIDNIDKSPSNHYSSKDDFSKTNSTSTDVLTSKEESKYVDKNNFYMKRKKMKAMFLKNIHQYFRHPGGLAFSFIFPLLQLFAFFTAVGHDPREINIVIVNDEIPFWSDCFNSTTPTVVYDPDEYTCVLNELSCKYIDSLDKSIIIKQFYPTLEEGKDAVRRGEALAVMHIPKTFTTATMDRAENGTDAHSDSIDNSVINLWMDMSGHQLAYFFKTKLYRDFVKFTKGILSECNYSPKLADIPINFLEPVYGNIDITYQEFMVPGVMMTVLFFLATTVTSTIVITDRLEGVWDRTIVAGVGSAEILAVHIFIQTAVLVFQTLEIMLITFVFYQIPFMGDISTVAFLLFLQGITGMCFGFLVSVICDTYTVAFFVSTGSFYPMIMLCGIVWPTEGMVAGVKYIAYTLPFTIPIKSMRNIITKGLPITNVYVYNGYLVTWAWIIGLLLVIYFLLQMRRK